MLSPANLRGPQLPTKCNFTDLDALWCLIQLVAQQLKSHCMTPAPQQHVLSREHLHAGKRSKQVCT